MSISIDLAADDVRKLEEKARARGQVVSDFVRDLIQRELNGGPGTKDAKENSLTAILTPIWGGWRDSGLSEEETEKILTQELEDVRRERRTQERPS